AGFAGLRGVQLVRAFSAQGHAGHDRAAAARGRGRHDGDRRRAGATPAHRLDRGGARAALAGVSAKVRRGRDRALGGADPRQRGDVELARVDPRGIRVAALAMLASANLAHAQSYPSTYDFGTPATPDDIASVAIAVGIDGKGLPGAATTRRGRRSMRRRAAPATGRTCAA